MHILVIQWFPVIYCRISHLSLVFSGFLESLAREMLYGNVGWYTAEYTTAFLYSDWLYYLRRGINISIYHTVLSTDIKVEIKAPSAKVGLTLQSNKESYTERDIP